VDKVRINYAINHYKINNFALYRQQTAIISFSRDCRHYSLFKGLHEKHLMIVTHCESW